MKIIVADSEPSISGNAGWHFLPDSALTNLGKPFYVPDFANRFEARLSVALRINRIGKTVAKKFAHRYFSHVAPAVTFCAADIRERLVKENLPVDMAYSFDRSLIVGDFIPVEKFLELKSYHICKTDLLSDTPSFKGSIDCDTYIDAANSMIEKVSTMNTIKMGDLFLPVSTSPFEVKIGDRLWVTLAGEDVFRISVK